MKLQLAPGEDSVILVPFPRTDGALGLLKILSWVRGGSVYVPPRIYRDDNLIVGGLIRFALYGVRPGGFVQALLENDLFESFARADAENTLLVRDYVDFMYNSLPGGTRGSPERIQEQIQQSGLFGLWYREEAELPEVPEDDFCWINLPLKE